MNQKTALARTNTTRGEPKPIANIIGGRQMRRRSAGVAGGWHLAPRTSPRPRGFVNVLTRQSELQGEGLFCQLPSAVPLIHLLIGFGSQNL